MTAMLSWHDHVNLSTAWETVYSDYRINGYNQCAFAALHVRKILCPKPLRLLLSFDVQSYFAAVLLSFLNIFFVPVFSELSLVANTHSGRELITA